MSFRRCRADTLVSCEPATETAQRPARNDSDIWTSSSMRYCSRINSQNSPRETLAPTMTFVSSQAVSVLPTTRPDHPKSGPFTAGTNQATIWPRGWDQEAIWAVEDTRRKGKTKFPVSLHATSSSNEKARHRCETALKGNSTNMNLYASLVILPS